MDTIANLAANIDRERIERARRMTMEERFLTGLRLYSLAIETVKAGIRLQFPNATPAEIDAKVQQRMSQSR